MADQQNSQQNSILVVEGLTKKFSDHAILHDIQLQVKKGEIFGIIGVSGAGKTTLLELLIGFLKPTTGDVEFRVGGALLNKENKSNLISVNENQDFIKHVFGFATQKPSFYDNLTVKENLDYFGALYELTDEHLQQNIKTALELVELSPYQGVIAKHLSGGMQKRLDIACSLIHNPEILILDEPTADLDIVLRKQLWKVIKRIRQNGKTVIISSHHLDEIEQLCDTIAVLHNGTIHAHGSVDMLRKLYSEQQEVHLETKSRRYEQLIALIKKQPQYKVSKMISDGRRLVIHAAEAEKLLHYILHIVEHLREEVVDVYLNRPSLNEVFEHLVEKKPDTLKAMHHMSGNKEAMS